MQPQNLEIAVYSFRFMKETLFPNEHFKAQDVAPGGKLYCLAQVFLDRIDPNDKPPVELLFGALATDKRFSKYPKCEMPLLAKQISTIFKKLTSSTALSLCDALHRARDTMEKKVEHAQIDERFTRAFEAVEQCLRNHPDKLAKFDTILSDWTKATPGFRARAVDFDPFIKELYGALELLR